MSLYEQIKGHAVTTDSRNCPEGSVFFALKGESFNGNKFAASALEKGCALAVVDEAEYALDERYVLVDNVLRALQEVARDYRIDLGLPVLGITGTNGKTTTKELTASVLKQKFKIHYTQGNLNNSIGVPLTVLSIPQDAELAIIEMGASHPGDIEELVNVAVPNAGLITNVGKAHLLGFGSFDGVKKTKGELYDFIRQTGGFIFRNEDNPHLAEMAGGLPSRLYSLSNADCEVYGQVTDCREMLQMTLTIAGETVALHTHIVGSYNAENVLAAAAVGHAFGLTLEQIKTGLEAYVPTNNRSMMQETGRNRVVVDAYNANPTSMHAAVENFHRMHLDNQTLILGDMLELGEQSDAEHQALVDHLQELGFKDVRLVGAEFGKTQTDYTKYASAQNLLSELQEQPLTNRVVLLKGSRGIHLETILPAL